MLFPKEYLNLHNFHSVHTKSWCSFAGVERRIYASQNNVTIGLYNGLSPVWHQAITWSSDGLLFVVPLGTILY